MEQITSKKDIFELECGHLMCLMCFDRLIRNSCPYCRHPIQNKEDGNYNIEYNIEDAIYDLDDEYIEIDNVLLMSELYYIEDLFYEDSYDIIHHNRRRKKKNNTRSRKKFTSNKNRDEYQRKKKKWKKQRN